MATSFFGGAFFGGEFFNEGAGGARPDDGGGRKSIPGIYKPTGLPPESKQKRRTLTLPVKARPSVDERAVESARIAEEVARGIAQEFRDGTLARERADTLATEEMLARAREEAMTAEIARLLHKKIRTEEEEIVLLLLMMSAAV